MQKMEKGGRSGQDTRRCPVLQEVEGTGFLQPPSSEAVAPTNTYGYERMRTPERPGLPFRNERKKSRSIFSHPSSQHPWETHVTECRTLRQNEVANS